MMNGVPAQAYRHAGVESAIAAASPHHLIVLLFQGARAAVALARNAMKGGNASLRGQAISKAIAIIDDGLNASLDQSKGGELEDRLHALYDYMVVRLTAANLENDLKKLDEVDRLLADIESAWRQIGAPPQPSPLSPAAGPGEVPNRSHSVSYGKV
jgi:flagellar protein FliS